jgi:hypothetical protein
MPSGLEGLSNMIGLPKLLKFAETGRVPCAHVICLSPPLVLKHEIERFLLLSFNRNTKRPRSVLGQL